MTSVPEYLLESMAPDRVAVSTQNSDFTYGQLDAAAGSLSRALMRSGMRQGTRVLLISPNSFHWVAAYLGILRGGFVCVPIPPGISTQELLDIANTSEAKAAFVQASLLTRLLPLLRPTLLSIYTEDSSGSSSGFVRIHSNAAHQNGSTAAPGDLAALMFTSGSTGRPRGVMVSHRNIIANTESILASLSMQDGGRMMTVLPFHYCFGTSLLHTHLRTQGTLVIDNRFAYPEAVLNKMQEMHCTSFAGVPSHYQILLRASSLSRRSFPHLKSLLQAGGHLAPQFVEQLQAIMPNKDIYIMYGQTEATARLACLPPAELHRKAGSIGRAIPGVVLRIMTPSGEPAPAGEPGEIVAQGENVAMGYWGDPDESSATFQSGRLHTGDIATMDEEGFLYISDRARNFVKCGGTRISCHQVEDELLACPQLLEAAVLGVPDEVLGEAIRAFVVTNPFADYQGPDMIRAFCRRHLPRNHQPREIIVLKSLPKNSSGKVNRASLKSLQLDSPRSSIQEMVTVQ